LTLANDSQWREAKYDHAYKLQLMSDDEDALDNNGNLRKVFISRAPLYRAKIVSDSDFDVHEKLNEIPGQ